MAAASPDKDRQRPNVLAGHGGRQFSFGAKAASAVPKNKPPVIDQQVNLRRPQDTPNVAEEDLGRSPFTYALHVVFTSFVRSAEKKINTLAGTSVDPEPDVLGQLGPGKDESFDKILKSLAYIARQDPKPVIDSVMFWRKSRAELRSEAQPAFNEHFYSLQKSGSASLENGPKLQRRPTQTPRPSFTRSPSAQTTSTLQDAAQESAMIISDRKSLLSIFILCRTLIEIISQLDQNALKEDVGDKLEEIVFNQLKNTDTETMMASKLRHANWSLFSELLGSLSALRFVSVSDRFIADLEKSGHGILSKEREARVEIVVRGMQHLKVRTYPVKHLEDSADFLSSLGRFFAEAHGAKLKLAYSEVLNDMISRVAAHGTAEFNFPSWVAMIAVITPRISKMLEKTRYWNVSFQLLCTLLCVSPRETFLENWFTLATLHLSRVRERLHRKVYLEGLGRLLWVATHRCRESPQQLHRKLESLVRHLFPAVRKMQYINDADVPALTFIASLIGLKLPALYKSWVLEPLLCKELLDVPEEIVLDNMQPERCAIVFNSCAFLLSQRTVSASGLAYPVAYNIPTLGSEELSASCQSDSGDLLSMSMMKYICRVALLYHHHYTKSKHSDDKGIGQTRPALAAFEINTYSLIASGQQWMDCVVSIIQLLPCFIALKQQHNQLIDILFKLSLSKEKIISRAACTSIKHIAGSQIGIDAVCYITRALSKTNEDSSILSSTTLQILGVYGDVVSSWSAFLAGQTEAEKDPIKSHQRISELGWNTAWHTIDEIEAQAFFHMSDVDATVRSAALNLLRLVKEVDDFLSLVMIRYQAATELESKSKVGEQAEITSRIFNLLQDSELAVLCHSRLTASTMFRSHALRAEPHTISILTIMTTSDAQNDRIWRTIYPVVVMYLFERTPVITVLCRNAICSSLQKMQSTIEDFHRSTVPHPNEIQGSRYGQRGFSSVGQTYLQQWRTRLIFACSTLTLTNEQVPRFVRRHGHKRSVPVAVFDSITSARTMLKLILPLLTTEHDMLREAVIEAISCVNNNLHETLLELLRPLISILVVKDSPAQSCQSPKIASPQDPTILRDALCRILHTTIQYLDTTSTSRQSTYALLYVEFVKDTKISLGQKHNARDEATNKLRCSFCLLLQAVWTAMSHRPEIETWLPHDGRVSCFKMLEEWIDIDKSSSERDFYAPSVSKENLRHGSKSRSASSTGLDEDELQHLAAATIASLCSGLTQPDTASFVQIGNIYHEHHAILAWLQTMLACSDERLSMIGKQALANLTSGDHLAAPFVSELVDLCYRSAVPERVREVVFLELMTTVRRSKSFERYASRVLALSLYYCGQPKLILRMESVETLRYLQSATLGADSVQNYITSIANHSIILYRKAQYQLSSQLANDHPALAPFIISEYCRIHKFIDDAGRPGHLRLLLPWLPKIKLELDGNGNDPQPITYMIFINLFELTLQKFVPCLDEIEFMWLALGKGNDGHNSKLILDLLFVQCVSRRDVNIVETAKQVVIYLNHEESSATLIDSLLLELEPRRTIPLLQEITSISMEEVDLPYCAELPIFPASQKRQIVFSKAQLSLIFLAALAVEPAAPFILNLPRILLCIFVSLDHYIPIVQNEALEFLLYLSYHYGVRPQLDTSQSIGLLEYLKTVRHNKEAYVWSYEELTLQSGTGATQRAVPVKMSNMLDRLLPGYSLCIPSIQQNIGALAMSWATSCPVRHIACRSFQLFRCLKMSLSQSMLADMLARLSNTICDPALEIRNFALEILKTIHFAVHDAPIEDLANHPQLFWCIIACLDTTLESEFLQALSTLEVLIEKEPLWQSDTHQKYLQSIPERWDGDFDGIFPLILKGVRSDHSMARCLHLIAQMLKIESCPLIGGTSRLLFSILAFLPSFVHSFEPQAESDISCDLIDVAETIHKEAQNQDMLALGKIFLSFSRSKFRGAEDFLRQTVAVIRECYFPQWEGQSLVFLLGLLSHRRPWMKLSTMEVLKAILPFVDTRRVEFVGVGADLISPLLRLLQTEFAQAALEVLDRALSISSGARDRQVLRMSLGNRTIRKEYEKTATLFGIPEESGWAVPMPIAAAARTRANVHSVFYSCAITTDADKAVDEVQFQMEDYSYQTSSDRSQTMVSERDTESTLGDMVSTLHNLDVFFAEDADTPKHHQSKLSDPLHDQAPASIYDSRVAAILSRSLARTPSISSFTSPGFDTSPIKDRLPAILAKPTSPTPNSFAFPKSTKSPDSNDSKVLPHESVLADSDPDIDSNRPAQVVLEDDKSETSFKLETQLKKSTPSVRSKLWSSKDPERIREKEIKRREKAYLKESKGKTSKMPSEPATPMSPTHGHSWFKRDSRHNE